MPRDIPDIDVPPSDDEERHEPDVPVRGAPMPLEESKVARAFSILSDLVMNAVVIVFLVLIVRFVLVSPFEVKGESMEPNFHTDDLMLVDKISYHFREPARGDVVVLIPPTNTSQFYVKRVVALPGEQVQFKNGKVVVYSDAHPEGETLQESYIPEDMPSDGQTGERVTVPSGSYYVLGDNRPHSNDSRFWGALPRANIVGRAWLVLWPLKDLAVLKAPAYAP